MLQAIFFGYCVAVLHNLLYNGKDSNTHLRRTGEHVPKLDIAINLISASSCSQLGKGNLQHMTERHSENYHGVWP